jgi:4-oxalocrotonate tautomerase
MPLIHVSMAEGRTEEQKRAMLLAISKAVQDTIGAPEASIRVWITEFRPTEYLAGTEILADRRQREA